MFRPERWLEQDASNVETPLGVYGNMREFPTAITPALATNGLSTGSRFPRVLGVVSDGGLRESSQLFGMQERS